MNSSLFDSAPPGASEHQIQTSSPRKERLVVWIAAVAFVALQVAAWCGYVYAFGVSPLNLPTTLAVLGAILVTLVTGILASGVAHLAVYMVNWSNGDYR